jgi:hypothetical protein
VESRRERDVQYILQISSLDNWSIMGSLMEIGTPKTEVTQNKNGFSFGYGNSEVSVGR